MCFFAVIFRLSTNEKVIRSVVFRVIVSMINNTTFKPLSTYFRESRSYKPVHEKHLHFSLF